MSKQIDRDKRIIALAQQQNAELKNQNAKMLEALKKVYSGYGDPAIQDMVQSLINDIEK